MESVKDLEVAIGERIVQTLKEEMGSLWNDLKADILDKLKDCAKVAGRLAIRSLTGEDVSNLDQHVRAQMANLLAVGYDMAVNHFWAAVKKVFEAIGEILMSFGKGAIKGLI